MRDVMDTIEQWQGEGQPVALATVVQTWGSSPRQAGAKMALTPGGQMTGSVSGGCVEGAVYDEGVAALKSGAARLLHFEEVQSDHANNWINLSSNDFDSLIPLASKDTKAATSPGKEHAICKLFSNGINTARDSWVIDNSKGTLNEKVQFFLSLFDTHDKSSKVHNSTIKWSRNLKVKLGRGQREAFDAS